MGTIHKLRVLSFLLGVASGLGCAVEPPDDDPTAATEENLDRGARATPVVVAQVDDATRAWIASERSAVDGEPIGESTVRQRELFVRVQRAINAKALKPALVHYGYYFPHKDEARKISDALADAIEDSPVPVVLEMSSAASAGPDRSIYHAWSLSDPPKMLVGESLTYSCSDGPCTTATMSMASPNPALEGLPVLFRAALEMSSGSRPSRRAAITAAKKSIGDRLPVATATRGFRTVRLRDVLGTPSVAASLEGAAVVVAPDVAAPRTEVTLDALKGATMAAVVAVP